MVLSKESTHSGKQAFRLFDIRHMPAIVQRDELGAQRLRNGGRRLERNRILSAMDHERRAVHGT
jgi:hypothetical protein